MIRTLAVPLCILLASPAFAQEGAASPEDRIAQLQAQVAELIAERDSLRVRLAEAIEMLRNLGYAPPAPVLAEPADPMASPLAAMQTLRRRARLELAPLPRETAEDRAAYREAAQTWVDKMNSALAGEKQWLVRVIEATLPTSSSSAARASAKLQLFDAATGSPLSTPLEVAVPGRVGRRMADAGPDQGWTAHVLLEPKVRLNPDRLDRGPFDHPPFLAPQVEATIEVQWLRFEPATVPDGFFPPLTGEEALEVPTESAPPNPPAADPARQPR